jgi:hypothetical protein
VTCDDSAYASAVLTPPVREWLLRNPTLEWRLTGNTLISWGTGRFVIADVQARLEAMSRLVELIPPVVLRDYGQPVY